MTPTPSTQEPTPAPTLPALTAAEFARRFAVIILGLCKLVSTRFYQHPKFALLHFTLVRRITFTWQRMNRAMARLEAGHKPRPPRPSKPRPDRPPQPALPKGHGWLLRELKWEVGAYRTYLENLLNEPGTAELIQACPAAARILRPLCNILALRHPLLTLPKRPRKPRPARPRPPRPKQAAKPAPQPAPAPPVRAPEPSHHWGRFEPSKPRIGFI